MADAKMINRQAWVDKIRRIPETVQQAAEGPLEQRVDTLLEALKRAAPRSEFDKHPGQLAEEIIKYKNADRPLSWKIQSIARDAAGRLYGRFVEFGHGAAGPRPWWFPTYRAWKKIALRAQNSAVRKALAAMWNR